MIVRSPVRHSSLDDLVNGKLLLLENLQKRPLDIRPIPFKNLRPTQLQIVSNTQLTVLKYKLQANVLVWWKRVYGA